MRLLTSDHDAKMRALIGEDFDDLEDNTIYLQPYADVLSALGKLHKEYPSLVFTEQESDGECPEINITAKS